MTRNGDPFVFGPEQEAAFAELKRRLADAETLGYFDRKAKRKITTDASPVGVGAVLVQEQKRQNHVICYASRGLSDVERRYSQTEREALGIVCEKIHIYLFEQTTNLLSLSTQIVLNFQQELRDGSSDYSLAHSQSSIYLGERTLLMHCYISQQLEIWRQEMWQRNTSTLWSKQLFQEP